MCIKKRGIAIVLIIAIIILSAKSMTRTDIITSMEIESSMEKAVFETQEKSEKQNIISTEITKNNPDRNLNLSNLDYEIEVNISSKSQDSYEGNIKITNISDKVLKNWTLVFNTENVLSNVSNSMIQSHIENTYILASVDYNKNINPGQSVIVNFHGDYKDIVELPYNCELSYNENELLKGQEAKFDYGNYNVIVKIDNVFYDSYITTITIRNSSSEKIENWNVKFKLDTSITDIWNAKMTSKEDNTYLIRNEISNQDIDVNSEVSFSFCAQYESDILLPQNIELVNFSAEVPATKYNVNYRVTSESQTSFNGEISITNNSNTILEDWKISFEFENTITQIWDAELIKNENNYYEIKNKGMNIAHSDSQF